MTFNTLEKALKLLDLFLTGSPLLSAAEICKALNMSRSNAHKYIATLKKHHFLELHPNTARYSLGLKFFAFTAALEKQFSVDKIALPFMQDLYNEVRETVICCELRNFSGYCIESIESESGLVYRMNKGIYMPLYCGALACVILANLEDADIEFFMEKTPLKQLAPGTITDKKKLWKKIRKIRREGFAYSHNEVTAGASAIAAPIFDSTGRIKASFGVLAPTKHLAEQRLRKKTTELIITYAKKISSQYSNAVS